MTTVVATTLDVVEFAERFWSPASLRGEPIRLEPHQKRILRHILTPGPDGVLPYEEIVWSEPKKSGKTEIEALITFWLAAMAPDGELYLLANDQDQSRARAFLRLTQALRRLPKGQARIMANKVVLANGSTVEALPCDWAGSAGASPSFTGWDELWAYRFEGAHRLWEELGPVPTRRNSVRLVVSYAGYPGESTLLEQLYHKGLEEGEPVSSLEDIDDGDGRPACRSVDGMFWFWSHVPRVPWLTPEYLARQRKRPGYRESAYIRQYENRWTASEESFVTPEQWAACKAPLPEDPRAKLVAGLDAARKRDHFAIVIVSRHPDPALHESSVVVRQVKIWKPRGGRAIDFEPAFEWLAEMYQRAREAGGELVSLTYDPWGVADRAERFGRKMGIIAREFNQQDERAIADGKLYDAIAAGQVVHDGDEELTQHVLNAKWVDSPSQEGRGRVDKLSPHRHIDACVALSMARAECLRLIL